MSGKIHHSAVIDPSAELGEDVVIGPKCVVDAGVVIGSGTIMDANVVIGRDVKIGKNNQLYANCAIGRPPQLLGRDPDAERGGLDMSRHSIFLLRGQDRSGANDFRLRAWEWNN